ncbi:MAG: M48 family metalloprotease [Alphaproteobacteria bacterium]|nr:M48 family metalloprotease [Alphaproteobacteria bacterium]MBV9063504.1 M48 family metalloprotease [Alphaproteobacteria bacterium]
MWAWRGFVLSSLASVMLLATAAHAGQGDGYPAQGTALQQLVPAADYTQALRGRPLALGILRARGQGYVPSPELHAYVKGVLLRLLANVKLPPSFKPDVRVLAAPEFTGECTPDGTLIVTVGLLEGIENEDELAFVIGHEVAHAIYRHEAKNWTKKSQYYAVVSGTASDAVARSQALTAAGFAIPYVGGALNLAVHLRKLSDNVLMPQMERGQEDAADALGFDLMVKAGYNPEAALAVMDKLAQQEAEAAVAAEQAKAAAKKSSNTANGVNIGMQVLGVALSGGTNALAWANLAVAGFGAAVDSMAEDATSHHPAKQREELLSTYAYREYRAAPIANVTALPWSPESASPLKAGLTPLLAHYTSAENAAAYVADASQGTAGGTRAYIAASTASPTADHAYTEFVAAEYYQLEKRPALSQIALIRAVHGPEPSWEVYSRLSDIYIAHNKYAKAQALMDEAARRFDNSPVVLPKRIEVLRGNGREAEAKALIAECAKYEIGELTDACKRAAGVS